MILDGACVLVTGAGRGIGRATVLELARGGAQVALAARSRDELEETAQEARALGARALIYPTDLTQPAESLALASAVERDLGRIDVLVNNAGGGRFAQVSEMPAEEFAQVLELNLVSVYRLTRAVLPGMMARRRGHIVMMASTAARRGMAGGAAYCAAKFGLNGFAQSLFYETRKYDVRVTTIFPSSVDTTLLRDVEGWASGTAGRSPETATSSTRLTRAEDIAHAVAAAIRMEDRATVHEIEVWGTNP